MITLSLNETVPREFPAMSRSELDSRWQEAKTIFDQALARKAEVDRIYQAAANELNAIERIMKKMERRAAQAQRDAIRLMRREI